MANFRNPAERKIIQDELEERAYQFLVLPYKKEALNLGDFEGVYPKEVIRADQDRVEKIESKFGHERPENERRAEILEAIVFNQAELNNWFGENSFTVRTSRFDDLVNGVDMVLEVMGQNGISRFALALDVTTTADEAHLLQKLRAIKGEVVSGQLTEVKYAEEKKEALKNVPRVILAAGPKVFQELTEAALNKDRAKLKDHFIQREFLEEVVQQLEKFSLIAPPETKLKLSDAAAVIRKILQTKQQISSHFREDDPSFALLINLLETVTANVQKAQAMKVAS